MDEKLFADMMAKRRESLLELCLPEILLWDSPLHNHLVSRPICIKDFTCFAMISYTRLIRKEALSLLSTIGVKKFEMECLPL